MAPSSLPLVLLPSAAFQLASEWELLGLDEAAAVVIIAGGDDVPAQLLALLSEAPHLLSLPMLITGAPHEARALRSLVEALERRPRELHVDLKSACPADSTAWVGLMLSALELEERPVAFVTSRTIAETALGSARVRGSSAGEEGSCAPTVALATEEGLRFGYDPRTPSRSTWSVPPALRSAEPPASLPAATGVREFLAADGQRYCYDAASGQVYWKEEGRRGASERASAGATAVMPTPELGGGAFGDTRDEGERGETLARVEEGKAGEGGERNERDTRGEEGECTVVRGADAGHSQGGDGPAEGMASGGVEGRESRASVRASSARPREFTPARLQEALLLLQQQCSGAHAAQELLRATDLAALSEQLDSLKGEMMGAAKLSHALQLELHELERSIALQIRHRMEVMETAHRAKGGRVGKSEEAEAKHRLEPEDRRQYERLAYLVRVNPAWLARLLVRVSHEKAGLVQLIVFVLYADMHDYEEDRLLLQLFGEALSIETKQCTDIGEFMRSNTPLTECLSKYNTREPSREALLAMLKQPMADLQARGESLNLEIEPLRVYRELHEDDDAALAAVGSNEEALAVAEVKARVDARVRLVLAEAEKLLDAITHPSSVEGLPFGMRWIAKAILQLTRHHWPRATDEQVYPLVGGFLFLRFINPVIVAPETVGLLSVAPTKLLRRNLLLLAKMLLALSNNVLFGQLGKESYMEPLNCFITNNRQRLRRYFDAVVAVPDLSMREMQIEKYLCTLTQHSSRFVHISYNELYFMHRLLLKHQDVLTHPAARSALAALTPPPEGKVPKDEDEEITLCMAADVALDWEELRESARSFSMGRASSAVNQFKPSLALDEDESGSGTFAPARHTLRQLLFELQLNGADPLPCTSWRELLDGLRVRAKKRKGKAPGLVDELERHIRQLELGGNEEILNLVKAALDEIRGVRILSSQVEKYRSSRDKMRAAAAQLQDNITMYEKTLEQIKRQSALKAKSTGAAQSPGAAEKDTFPGPFKFTHSQLSKRGLFVGLPSLPELSEKKTARLLHRATYVLELTEPGEYCVRALFKVGGAEQVIWEGVFMLDELLKQRAQGLKQLDVDGFRINIPSMLQLIDDKFR